MTRCEIIKVTYQDSAFIIDYKSDTPTPFTNKIKGLFAEFTLNHEKLHINKFSFYVTDVNTDIFSSGDSYWSWHQGVFLSGKADNRVQLINDIIVDNNAFPDVSDKSLTALSHSILSQTDGLFLSSYLDTLPIIHICDHDILGFDDSTDNLNVANISQNASDMDKPCWRYRNIMDSSIWNYFLPLSTKERLKYILEAISLNYQKGYYSLNITREFADFDARRLREDFVTGSHGAGVVPFVFHSEHMMYQRILEILMEANQNNVSYIQPSLSSCKEILFKGLKWRFLLMDDKVGDRGVLTNVDQSENRLTKADILVDRISKLGFKVKSTVYDGINRCVDLNVSESDEPDILLVCAKDIDSAYALMKTYEFDIIFLDYLLEVGEPSRKRYGHELLTKLMKVNDADLDANNFVIGSCGSDDAGSHIKVGPNERFFFMFISAFSSSVSERLRESGVLRSEARWHIGEGACPTSTPMLFLYLLVMLMLKRLKDSGIKDLMSDSKLKDLLGRIFKNDKIKKAADNHFNELLNLMYKYKAILKDVSVPDSGNVFYSDGSVLCTSFMMTAGKQRVGGLLEHAVHLVYLTAFGTVRQWPEIWEEYRFVSTQLGEIPELEDYVYRLKNRS